MATFVWEYHATHGTSEEPHGYQACKIYIGFGGEVPVGAEADEETYQIHIDPACDEALSTGTAGYLQTEWGDVLRLPVDGPYSQDHPYITAARRMRTSWYGNAKLFPSIYDLMIAVSFHTDGNIYRVAERSGIGAPYELIGHPDVPHPMSGVLPSPQTLGARDRLRLLSILLGSIHMALAMEKSGHLDGKVRIYSNLYSAFSADVSPVVLLISYFGIHCSGDGSVQEKLVRMAEFRYAVADYMRDVVRNLIEITKTPGPAECAAALMAAYR
jgi:hypothetical protein